MENYFASQRDNIFKNVEVLIYVFDVESRELGKYGENPFFFSVFILNPLASTIGVCVC